MVVALGGNALRRRGETGPSVSPTTLRRAAAVLAQLASRHQLVITHGNGPQVGLLALRAESHDPEHPTPLDLLGAETEGMIGYLLERELRTLLPEFEVAALLTQVRVDPADDAFAHPTKPIGPVYSREEAERLGRERGWRVAADGEHWRRVVASPRPLGILEAPTLRLLVEHQILVVCGGGGGIPVSVDEEGAVRGIEAVVDKDATASLLARELEADRLVLLTDVDGVYRDFGAPGAALIRELTLDRAREVVAPPGSMGTKVAACIEFLEAGGAGAAIGALEDGVAVAAGAAGTQFVA